MNTVVLIGRTTKDPEVRYSGDTAIAKFTLAIDRYSKGEKEADFIPVTVFGKQAENVEKFVGKGQKVAVEGRIQTGSYEKDGRRIYTTDVIANRVEFLEFNGQRADLSDKNSQVEQSYQNGTNYSQNGSESVTEGNTRQTPVGFDDLDEDIPF